MTQKQCGETIKDKLQKLGEMYSSVDNMLTDCFDNAFPDAIVDYHIAPNGKIWVEVAWDTTPLGSVIGSIVGLLTRLGFNQIQFVMTYKAESAEPEATDTETKPRW